MGDGGLSGRGLRRLHDVLARHVEGGSVPGLVALVARRGAVHVEALGSLAVAGDKAAAGEDHLAVSGDQSAAGGDQSAGGDQGVRPVRRDSIFRVSSMTKPVTAVAALTMVEECLLRLDDPVDDLLPELANRRVLARLDGPLDDTVPAHRPITLRDLLTFSLGYGIVLGPPGDYPIQEALVRARAYGPPDPVGMPPPDEWLRGLVDVPLVHQPGEQWLYNTGSDVLGVLLARVAGRDLGTVLRERVFDPLGMADTGFHVPAGSLPRLTTHYAPNPATGALHVTDPVDGAWAAPPAFPSGAGGLVSTVDDYLALGRMLLGGGRHPGGRLLARPTVEAMVSDQLTPAQKAASRWLPGFFENHGWGFGVSVVTRRHSGPAVPGSFGWDGGLGSSWRCDPAEDLVGVLLTSRSQTSATPPAVTVDFWTSAYQAIDD
jgi:CubicO group peptidase (beta-lactamase class C family)